MSERPLLLYDGICALCNGTVAFVLARDRRGAARFAPLSGETARAALAGRPELRGIDSIVWIDAEEIASTRSGAVIAIARYLGGVWSVAGSLLALVPKFLRDPAYDLVARWRYRVFGRYDACPVPPTVHRARFLP
jgi:predicted DCC family thiol-disulfide oxidoreductase YuxK